MRNKTIVWSAAILSLLVGLTVPRWSQAQSEVLIPFQGRLTDGSGTPVPDGVYRVTFALYDTPTGGTALEGWTETHPAVSVKDGVLNVFLGSDTPLNDPNKDGNEGDRIGFSIDDGPRYVGVKIGEDFRQEMSPRHLLVPSFHARRADRVEDGAITQSQIASGAVVTAHIDDGAITTAKFASGAVAPNAVYATQAGNATYADFALNGSFTTGDVKLTLKTTADPGWVMMDDGSIGNASSGATTLADASTYDLFVLVWNNVAEPWAPVQNSDGTPANRSATVQADWDANRRLVLPQALGRALAAAGAGFDLTPRVVGETLGEEEHTLTKDETPVSTIHNGGGEVGLDYVDPDQTGTSGGGQPHNNMQPTLFLNVMIKL